MIEEALILAGGLATRLGPLTAARPKSLIEVEGVPFIRLQLDLLKRNGIAFRALTDDDTIVVDTSDGTDTSHC